MESRPADYGVIPSFGEQHFSVKQISQAWNVSEETVRRLFGPESDVFILERPSANGKRKYRTIRIPAHVVERVHQNLCNRRVA